MPRSVAHEYAWPDFQPARHELVKLSPASLDNLEGTYAEPGPDGQDKLTITVRDGHPYLTGSYSVGSIYHFTLSEPVELFPETRQQYFTLLTGDTNFRFEKNEKGIVDRCIVVSGMKEREAKKSLRNEKSASVCQYGPSVGDSRAMRSSTAKRTYLGQYGTFDPIPNNFRIAG